MLNITKGVWKLSEGVFSSLDLIITTGDRENFGKAPICEIDVYFNGAHGNEQQANANLIAEAGTVANECGLTPRQLLEQRNELVDVLDKLANGVTGCGWDNGLVPRLQNARELLDKIKAVKSE